jgi:hypothetical protein
MGVSSFFVLAGTMENTPLSFLPQDFTQKILRYLAAGVPNLLAVYSSCPSALIGQAVSGRLKPTT